MSSCSSAEAFPRLDWFNFQQQKTGLFTVAVVLAGLVYVLKQVLFAVVLDNCWSLFDGLILHF